MTPDVPDRAVRNERPPPEYLSLRLRIAHAPGSLSQTREDVRDRLARVATTGVRYDVALVMSELAGHVMAHGDGPVELRVVFDGRRVTGELADETAQAGAPATGRCLSPGRRRLVQATADRYGTQPDATYAWFQIDTEKRAVTRSLTMPAFQPPRRGDAARRGPRRARDTRGRRRVPVPPGRRA